ncbi:Ribosomal protein S18 acetylase RimI [Glycomyces sambucus]|uniref:Ribosomal protein S18 acetylase RimI n=1 Tax=Glycomyces sambucus TaxID=380244 RepID=A0A1G9CZ31_9ACTN|nr:Ribosomal protein S18 acetylase RimI [Glycomyces sambucus]
MAPAAPAWHNPHVDIREVRPAEYTALGDLTVDSYLRGGFLIGGLQDGYTPRLRDVAERAASATVLVAVEGEGDRLLGGVTIAFQGSPLMELGGDGDAEIRMLAVAPEAAGKGAGSALAAACVERARAEAGTKRIVLCSQREMTTAHRIYRRLGFEREPSLDWEPLPGVPLWAFSLAL